MTKRLLSTTHTFTSQKALFGILKSETKGLFVDVLSCTVKYDLLIFFLKRKLMADRKLKRVVEKALMSFLSC